MFRAKKLDLGCFVNTRIIRDHTKRKVFEQHEPERQVENHSPLFLSPPYTPFYALAPSPCDPCLLPGC
jgi:hypothetical protein